MRQGKRESSRPLRVSLIVLCVAVLVGLSFWAGMQIRSGGQPAATPGAEPVFATAQRVEVGRTLTLTVRVEQPQTPVAANLMSGVLTSLPGEVSADVGTELYRVNDVPVRSVEGSVPFYREMSRESKGTDVLQLNNALVELGYLGEADDQFDAYTEAAVKQWQKDLGLQQTGIVAAGELVALPSLPAHLVLDGEKHRLGSVLSGGESIVMSPSATPSFHLVLSNTQVPLVPTGAPVRVLHADHAWPAITGEGKVQEDGSTHVALIAPDGGLVCQDQCGTLPAEAALTLVAEVVLVPKAEGIGIPQAALKQGPDGEYSVRQRSEGAVVSVPVSVISVQDGVAVVTGLEAGAQVEISGPEPGAGPPAPSVSPS